MNREKAKALDLEERRRAICHIQNACHYFTGTPASFVRELSHRLEVLLNCNPLS